jgi:hypothetical protein
VDYRTIHPQSNYLFLRVLRGSSTVRTLTLAVGTSFDAGSQCVS